jgi:rhodanese-related sulfurtransferase
MLNDLMAAISIGVICFVVGIVIQTSLACNEEPTNTPLPQEHRPETPALGQLEVISLAELKSLLEENTPILIDVRDEDVFLRGQIPGALNYPLKTYESFQKALLEELETSEHPIILYCGSKGCKDSQLMADKLAEAGIPKSRLFVYKGGWIDWAINRGKIETGPARSLISE